MSRTFDFGDIDVKSAVEGGGGGRTLPGGEYIAQIVDIEEREEGFAKSGAHAGWPSVNLQLKITASGTGVGVGQTVRRFNLGMFPKFDSGKANFSFIQFFNALGVELSGKVTLPEDEDILGQEVGIVLGFSDPTKNKNGRIYNEVERFFPADNGVKEGAIPVPEAPEVSPAPTSVTGDTSQPWTV